jgi:hypothetical protein
MSDMTIDSARLEKMISMCRRLLEAEANCAESNDPETRQEYRLEGAKSFWDMVNAFDNDELISDYYAVKAKGSEYFEDKNDLNNKRNGIKATALFLLDLGGRIGHLSEGQLRRGMGGVASYLVDKLRGAKPSELLPPERQGKGNRPQPLLKKGSMRDLVQVVHYHAGKKGMSVFDSFQEITFDRNSLKPKSIESFMKIYSNHLDEAGCEDAMLVGQAAALGEKLSEEHEAIAAHCEHFIGTEGEKTTSLEELISRAYRKS